MVGSSLVVVGGGGGGGGVPVHDGSWPEAVLAYDCRCTDWDTTHALMVPDGSLLDYDMVQHWQSYLSS